MIRKVLLTEVPRLKEITSACALDMISQGIYQWNEHYPSVEVFREDVAKETVYGFEHDKELIGCVIFSFEKDSFYESVDWLSPEKKQLYVHRLAVDPTHQKKGIARKLMDYGEQLAKDNGCLSVRLDTFSENPRNNRFYQARGYKKVGEIYFSQKSSAPFYCYEKIL